MSKPKTTIVQSLLTMSSYTSSNIEEQVNSTSKKLTLVTSAGIITGIPLSEGDLESQSILLKDASLLTPTDKTYEYVFLYVFLDDIIAATI